MMDYPFTYIIYLLLIIPLIIVVLHKTLNWILGLRKVDRIDERFVFMTGCDSGFGEELCIELDRLGCHVFAGCLTVDGMVNIKSKCSCNVFPLILDVRDHASVLKCVNQIKLQLPHNKGLWGLVNNAGICGAIGPIQWLNASDFNEILQVNLLGAIDVTLCTLPLLRSENKYESARIVNMTSILAYFQSPCTLPYCLSKSALLAFSNCLRLDLKHCGIQVSTIHPGAHKSNLTKSGQKSLKTSWERLSAEERKTFGLDYYERISKYENTFLAIFAAKKDYSSVIDSYTHALFSRRPRTTYIIGYDAIIMYFLSYLPRFILDFMVSVSGIVPKPRHV